MPSLAVCLVRNCLAFVLLPTFSCSRIWGFRLFRSFSHPTSLWLSFAMVVWRLSVLRSCSYFCRFRTFLFAPRTLLAGVLRVGEVFFRVRRAKAMLLRLRQLLLLPLQRKRKRTRKKMMGISKASVEPQPNLVLTMTVSPKSSFCELWKNKQKQKRTTQRLERGNGSKQEIKKVLQRQSVCLQPRKLLSLKRLPKGFSA